MPSYIRIPPHYRAGIQIIANLDVAAFDRLTESLRDAPQRLASERLAREIEGALPDLPGSALDVVEALLSLIALLDEDEARAEQLANDVAHSEDLEIAETDQAEFARRMLALLTLRPVSLAARAYDIVAEHERVFHDARIFTDIRPVFGPSAAEGARAALIVAMLKIDFHPSSGAIESFFFAMDHDDLNRLRGVVDRAQEKIDGLEKLISEMGLPYWEYREVEETPHATSS